MSQDALASELAPQGRKVFVPKYGVRNLTQFRKRAWTLLCEAFKYPKAYPRLSRRDREDPSRPVASTDRDAPASRQIHAQRREAVELNILAWLSTVVSLTTWEVTVKDREAIDALGMGKRRIQRGLKDVETRGFITLKKSANGSWTIKAEMSLWASLGLDGRARGVTEGILAKERSQERKAKAEGCRKREAEEKRQAKGERHDEIKAQSPSGRIDPPSQRRLDAMLSCYKEMPLSVMRQLIRAAESGTMFIKMLIDQMIKDAPDPAVLIENMHPP